MDLVIKAKEIKGNCPTYKVGDSFTLKAGYQLVSEIHAGGIHPVVKQDASAGLGGNYDCNAH